MYRTMATEDNYLKEFIDAVMSNNSEVVHEILNIKGTVPSDMLDECLLNFICEKNQNFEDSVKDAVSYMSKTDIIYMLLDAGANIDKPDELGNTCLFYAAMNENLDFCDTLLQCGADMWASTEHGMAIYDYVTQVDNSSQDLVNTFNKYYPGLWKAVEYENIYQVRQLINCWCRTSIQKNGLTLKDIALQTGNEEIINLILGVYESMDMVYHILAKNTQAVKKMLETCKRKIRLNLRKMSDHGAPILYYLIQSRDVFTIELFIQYGCQIYTIMQDDQGNDMPVLFSALKPDMSVSVLEALLPKGKTQLEEILYKILYKGKTVLEVAMENRVSAEVFNLLIYRGGPLLLCDRNQFNETVRDIAESQCQDLYVSAIDQCVHDWIVNPLKYPGKREKLAVLGWKFEFIQYTENGVITENALQFSSDVNLLQAQIKELSMAIENGNVSKFIELKDAASGSNLAEANLLWHARVVGDGIPLLHRSVLHNQPDIAEIILNEKPLKESIDNLFDQHHRTALHYAFACSSTKKIQKLLLNCGCSEHVLDKGNREPLDFRDQQDSSAVLNLIERLKFKKFSELEPDPWNNDAIESDRIATNNISNCTGDHSCDCDHEHHNNYYDEDCDISENGNWDVEDDEYENFEDSLQETESEEEEETPTRCHIS